MQDDTPKRPYNGKDEGSNWEATSAPVPNRPIIDRLRDTLRKENNPK